MIVGDNEYGVKTVIGAAGAIGNVSFGTAEANIANGAPIRLLPLAGVPASTARVASGEFPMSRPLNLVTKSAPSPLAKAFICFCQSSQVYDLVESQHFVPFARDTDVTK